MRSFRPIILLNSYNNRIKGALLLALKKEGPQKMELFLKVKYYKEDKDGNKTEHSAYHNGLLHTCLREEEYDEIYEQSVAKIMAAFDAFNKT